MVSESAVVSRGKRQVTVSRGAAEEPRFVILEHRGGKKGEKPVVLVGKGVTFDSGGLSIKPSDQMGDRKWDMMGAATVCVLGLLLLLVIAVSALRGPPRGAGNHPS